MEKIKLLLYCTKQKPYLIDLRLLNCEFELWDCESPANLNGKIVAECEYKIEPLERIGDYIRFAGVEDGEWLNNRYYEYKSCLSEEELFNYVK